MKYDKKISLLSSPKTVDIGEWVMNNIGMVAVAKRTSDYKKAIIYVIERTKAASPQMIKYAKDNNAMILVGLSEDDFNAID